jgi:hypothetical protein
MRRLIAVAIVVAGVALPVCAQRGGGHGGGGHSGGGFAGHSGSFASHSGGFAGHSAPAFRSSYAPMSRPGFMGAPQASANRYAAAARSLSAGRGPVGGYPYRRPGAPDRRSDYRGDDRYRRPYIPAYGLGFPSGFSIWPGSLLDDGFYDDPGFYDNSGYDDSNYANPAPPADYGPQQYPAPPDGQADVVPPGPYRPAYAQPQPPPEPESAVTLVFKDGRPSEQIHNYMLTRTTLYVQDEHRRQIPVDDLDLAATQKVNKDAGVDFQLPGSGR